MAAQGILRVVLLAVIAVKSKFTRGVWIDLCSKMASAYTLPYPSHAFLLETLFFPQNVARDVFFGGFSSVYSREKKIKSDRLSL